jgi:hypothetical protein
MKMKKVSVHKLLFIIDNRFMLILLLVIIGTEILDISVNKVYLFISSSQFSITWNVLAFISVAIVYTVGQYIILEYVKKRSKEIKTKGRLHFSIIYKVVKGVQYALIGILLAVILQMIMTSLYNDLLVLSSIWISYILAICMLALLARHFFSWYIANRNVAVLSYGLAASLISINAGTSLVLSTLVIIGQPSNVQQISGTTEGSMPDNILPLNNAFIISSVMSFILMWIAAVIVLHHYSKRVGKTKYWIIVSIPLVYFLSQFQPLFLHIFSSYSLAQPFTFATIYTIIFSASKPGGGILFAAAFWSIASKIDSKQLREYMIISAYGLALIFGSEQAILLVNRIYPPFGLATISFFGLASYLVLVGIYSSAISISEDSKLRRSIRNLAMDEAHLLGSIGIAQMEREIQDRVISITKQNQDRMLKETGIQSSFTEEEMKVYLDQVIREIKKDDDH